MIPRIGTKTKNAFFLFSSSPSPISPRLFSSSGQKKNNIELEEWLNNPQSHPYPPSLLDTSSLGEGVCPSSLGLSIFPEFVTEEEEKQMAKEILEQFGDKPFEQGHWDNAISGYREVQVASPSLPPTLCEVFSRALPFLLPFSPIPQPAHLIDYQKGYKLFPHIDSSYAGDCILGISLLSPCIMIYRHQPPSSPSSSSPPPPSSTTGGAAGVKRRGGEGGEGEKEGEKGCLRALLPPRSLYRVTGDIRENWTHEINAEKGEGEGEGLRFGGEYVGVDKRMAVILRGKPKEVERGEGGERRGRERRRGSRLPQNLLNLGNNTRTI